MDTSLIDSAIDAASVFPMASDPTPVHGWPKGTNATLHTLPFRSVSAEGFRIIGKIEFPNGYTARRIVDVIGKNSLEARSWPPDIEAESNKFLNDTFLIAERYLDRCGFSAVRLVSLLNLYLSALAASGNDAAALAASRPKLAAVYAWAQQVQGVALHGSRIFPPAPHKFEEVMLEAAS